MALLFDDSTGDGQLLNVDSAVVTATPYTIHCWFNSDNDSIDQYPLAVGDKDVADDFAGIQLRGSQGGDYVAVFSYSGAFRMAVSAKGYVPGQWHSATAVFASDSSRKIYLDGAVPVENTQAQVVQNIDRTRIGRSPDRTDSLTGEFSGSIAETAIWDVALTDREVQQLHIGFSPPYLTGLLPHLKLYKSLRRFINGPDDIGPDMQAWSNDELTTRTELAVSNHPPNIIDPPEPWNMASVSQSPSQHHQHAVALK